MSRLDPVLVVLLSGSLAAGAAALGVLPFLGGRRPPGQWIGAAYALAGGAMLGAGYLLMSSGLAEAAVSVVAGALAGVAYTRWVRAYAGAEELDGQTPTSTAEYGSHHGYHEILQNTLHAAAEGVAIGAAMALDLRLGVFLALALAAHNVGEAMALIEVLRDLGMKNTAAAGLAVVTNVTQPLLAVFAFALAPALEGLLPALLGFAAGALFYLTLTELMPASYRRAGQITVAFLVSASTAGVVLLQAFIEEGWP